MPFSSLDRQLLLTVPGVGPAVINRLESVGIHSLAELAVLGPDMAVMRVCHQLGTRAWENRRKALTSALQLAAQRRSQRSVQGGADLFLGAASFASGAALNEAVAK